MISRLSISDVYLAAKQLNKIQVHNGSLETNSTVTSFLTSVTKSCKALGQSAKALTERCKKLYALSNCFGPPSVFFTITPDDVCILCVHMYANQGNKTKYQLMIAQIQNAFKILNFNIEKELDTLEHCCMVSKLPCKLFVNSQDRTTRQSVTRVLVCLQDVKHLLELTWIRQIYIE